MKRPNKATCERVARNIHKAFPAYKDAPPPVVRMDWDPSGAPMVFWEAGPFEWAMAYANMTAGFESVDQEFGGRHKPVKPVTGVEVEPYFSFAVSVYDKDEFWS